LTATFDVDPTVDLDVDRHSSHPHRNDAGHQVAAAPIAEA
jgi:hypothetical protein